MTTKVGEVKDLKEGKLVVIDGEPCKVVSMQVAKTGKHGSAKARVEGIGIFDDQKRSFIGPVESRVEIPVLERKNGQVLAFIGNNIQLMDLTTYETFEIPMPKEEEVKGSLAEGVEVEYIETMGRRKIVRRR